MSLILMTRDEADEKTLVHYRTPGSKNGVRKYQNEDGSLTPLGRIHYGVGKAREHISDEAKVAAKKLTTKYSDDKKTKKVEAKIEKAKLESKQQDEKVKKLEERLARIEQKKVELNKSDAEIKKDVEKKIEEFNEKKKLSLKERTEKMKEEKAGRQKEIEEIRSLSDMELSKRIERLQKERTLSELINERSNYEKSPFQAKAAKVFQDFAENFARKALNRAGDELLNKLMEKAKNGSNSGVIKTNNTFNNNNKPSNDNSKPKDQSSGYGSDNRFSKQDKSRIKSMAGSGKSIADIAQALHTTEDRVKGYMSAAGITIK